MSKFARLVLAGALTAACSLAAAADASQPITVTASVLKVCTLTAPATLAITADPSSNLDASSTADISFKCTKDLPYTFTVSHATASSATGTLAGTLTNGTNTVNYTANWTPPSGKGAGFSTEVAADVTVTVAYAAYQDLPAGDYTGAVTVNINY